MLENPFRKKTASERLAEGARSRFSAAAGATQGAGLSARDKGFEAADSVASTAKGAGDSLYAAIVPTIAGAFAAARSATARGVDEGVERSASRVSSGLESAPDQIDSARDWLVEDLLPRIQEMVDHAVDAKDEAADEDGALSALAGETVRKRPRKGGVLMLLGLALLGGAGYFWYTDEKRRQGDPWGKVRTVVEDPWAARNERRAVSAAANPGAGTLPSRHTTHTEQVDHTSAEGHHRTPSEAAAARAGTGPVSALATPATTSATPAGTVTTTTTTSTPAATTTTSAVGDAAQRPTGDGRQSVAPAGSGLGQDAATGPIATGHARSADEIAGDNAPTQSIPTVGERLNPRDQRPADNNPYLEDEADQRS
ncbi:hypothetical protein SAMN05445756_1268 [Kytococcus aerolatus]|uniref:Uncharacterized protein n=1 Tax=Kytococcus aerolatus TaxID=592308 RepID=A0A212TGN6_9MICO|nr:hypothetical protein [Kytococcus aerolatus]SNC65182.1 hypothetical protein SAMN05445756_1268 [Kytococcus aerolatus]